MVGQYNNGITPKFIHTSTNKHIISKPTGKDGADRQKNQWNGHEKAPIYKDLAKRMGINPKTKKSYTPSEMSGAIYSNLVGQGDDGKEAMDSYLTEDGKQFLRKMDIQVNFHQKMIVKFNNYMI